MAAQAGSAAPRLPRSVSAAEVDGTVVLVRADLNVPIEDGRGRRRQPHPRLAADARAAARPRRARAARLLAPGAAQAGRPRALLASPRCVSGWANCCRTSASRCSRTPVSTPRETANDPVYAAELAAGCDLYVNDAFGSAHRAHASTEGVAHLLPAYAGLLLLAELENLARLLGEVERPFVIVSGGAKVEDKRAVLERLGARADRVVIGGKMAEDVRRENPFSFEVLLPSDVVAASAFAADAETRDRGLRRGAGRLARARHRPAGAPRSSPRRSPRRAPSSGTARWASSSGRASRRAPSRSPARSPPATASRSSAAATRCAPCTRRASPTRVSLDLDRRRRLARVPRGQGAAGRRGDPGRVTRRADRGQLEDVQGAGTRRAPSAVRCARPTSAAPRSSSARPTSRCRRPSRRSPAPRSPSPPRTSTGSRRGPSPARSRRRCCASSASTARSSATPSGGSASARPTQTSAGALARRARAASLGVIACVGETEAEREAGETEAVLARQVEAIAAAAAEPDGLVDRLRAGLGDRHGQDGDPGASPRRRTPSSRRSSTCRCSTAARSSPTTPPSSPRSPTSTARSSAAPRSSSSRSRRSAAPRPAPDAAALVNARILVTARKESRPDSPEARRAAGRRNTVTYGAARTARPGDPAAEPSAATNGPSTVDRARPTRRRCTTTSTG